ncbi:hypothetical protein HSIEG1_2960 [Enterococcus sp. HSIEG1]|nr:hypothetical protein HSIEG1_2960 [Enterococcus sp. HSIEG1]
MYHANFSIEQTKKKAGFPHKKRTITCDRSFELKELSFTS